MQASPKYSWQPAFLTALSDLQSAHLPVRIARARALIDARVEELLTVGSHDQEQVALIDALFALHCVERYRKTGLVKSQLHVAS